MVFSSKISHTKAMDFGFYFLFLFFFLPEPLHIKNRRMNVEAKKKRKILYKVKCFPDATLNVIYHVIKKDRTTKVEKKRTKQYLCICMFL